MAAAVPAVAQEKPVKKVLSPHAPGKTPMFNGAIGFGNLVFLAGIGYHKEGDIKVHTKGVLDQIKENLEKVGSSMDKVLKCVVYLANGQDFAGMNEVYSKYFTHDFPARSTIQVAALPKGANVEIEVIAHF